MSASNGQQDYSGSCHWRSFHGHCAQSTPHTHHTQNQDRLWVTLQPYYQHNTDILRVQFTHVGHKVHQKIQPHHKHAMLACEGSKVMTASQFLAQRVDGLEKKPLKCVQSILNTDILQEGGPLHGWWWWWWCIFFLKTTMQSRRGRKEGRRGKNNRKKGVQKQQRTSRVRGQRGPRTLCLAPANTRAKRTKCWGKQLRPPIQTQLRHLWPRNSWTSIHSFPSNAWE